MSARKSEENYKLAKSLYYDISDSFYEIENSDLEDKSFVIDQTLNDIKKLKRVLDRIDIEELESTLDIDTMDIVEDNINGFREAAYFIEKSLSGIKYYDNLIGPLADYMKNVKWDNIDKDKESAIKKVAGYLTHADNYETFKNQINAIARHSMPKRTFNNLFYSVESNIRKPKTKKLQYRHPLPPEMYSKEGKKQIAKEKEKARKEAEKYDDKEGAEEWDITSESFITFKKFKKLVD